MLNTIYILKNKINSKIYIGQTWRSLSERWDSGHGYDDSPRLNNAIRKYGNKNFYYEVITFCGTQEAADACEIYFIAKYNSTNREYGYNIREGGSRGKLSENTKQKISISLTGKKQSEETKMKRSLSMTGKKSPKSAETREKISETLTGRKMPEEQRLKMMGKESPFEGKSHSKETCKKISDANIGRTHSDETKEKMSNSHIGKNTWSKGRKLSETHKNKCSKNMFVTGHASPLKGKKWKMVDSKRIYFDKDEG
jgi:group I intron endonuclease